MTISDPESMLLGGLEVTLIPQPTARGAANDLASLSVSTLEVSLNRTTLPNDNIEVTLQSHRNGSGLHHILINFGSRNALYFERWQQRALARMLEIWGKANRDLMLRGFKGNKKFWQEMAGVLGSAHKAKLGFTTWEKGYADILSEPKPIKQDDKGIWRIDDSEVFLDYFHKFSETLSPEAIQTARDFANEYAKTRKA